MVNRSPVDRSHSPQGRKNWSPDLADRDGELGLGKAGSRGVLLWEYLCAPPPLTAPPAPPPQPGHLPCQAQAPQQNHQLQCQVSHKERVVAFAHTVLHPGAVVIIAANTAAALTAVPGTQGLLWVV